MKVVPPSVLTSTARVGPDAAGAAVKVTVLPASTVWLVGLAVTVGA